MFCLQKQQSREELCSFFCCCFFTLLYQKMPQIWDKSSPVARRGLAFPLLKHCLFQKGNPWHTLASPAPQLWPHMLAARRLSPGVDSVVHGEIKWPRCEKPMTHWGHSPWRLLNFCWWKSHGIVCPLCPPFVGFCLFGSPSYTSMIWG